MKLETIDGRVNVEVFTRNGETQKVLGWFERLPEDGILTVYMELGRVRRYEKRSGQIARPQEKVVNATDLARYKTPDYAWNNGR